MKLRVKSTSGKHAEAAVMEKLINQPSVIALIEKRMADYYQARLEGLSEEDACKRAGLDPKRPGIAYGDR